MIALKNNFCIRRAKEMRWMLISNNWIRFLGSLEWPEQLWKRHLKPSPKTNQCFVLFYIWIGGAKRGKEYWDGGPWERKIQPYRKFRTVGAKCPEFGMQSAVIKLLPWASEEPIFIFSHTKMTTLRWLHNRWLLLLPWVKKLSCGPSHLLLQFLAMPAAGF